MANHMHSSLTQVYWTCRALMNWPVISQNAEIREVKVWRFAAIVHRLKDDCGWPVLTDYRGPQNVAQHWLAPGTDVSRLRFPPSATVLAEGGAQ